MADRFVMDEVRKMAINAVNALVRPPAEKVQLGRMFGYGPWVKDGFFELLYRREPLTEEEALLIGVPSMVKCAAARQAYYQSKV